MRKGIKIYLMALKNSFASRLTYRADFMFSVIMIFISELVIPLFTLLIYKTGASFPGWSVNEVLLLQGVFLLSRGIATVMFFGLVWNTLFRVKEGTYDILLIKPSPVLFLSIATSFEPDGIGMAAGGMVVCLYALSGIPTPGLVNIFMFLLLLFLSLMVLFSFALLMAGSVFKWVGNSRIFEIFDSIASFGNYPRSIFSKGFQTVIGYVIPISAIGFLPASVLLGKNTDGWMMTALVSVLFLAFSFLFWVQMLKNYTSAGG